MAGRRLLRAFGAALLLLGAVPRSASAQWYFASFTGVNHTQSADVVIDQPELPRHLTFGSVPFRGEPLKSPQYYGGRLGYLFRDGRIGVEGEFLHIKVIATTAREVRVTGQAGGAPVDVVQPMNLIVQDFEMSHGLNFWFTNLVWRMPAPWLAPRDRLTVALRAGAGPVVAGVSTRVDHVIVDHYEFAGVGLQGAAGVEVLVAGSFAVTGEYKLTYVRPRIDVPGGTGQTTALTHHVAAGFSIGFAP
jgi:hypothetical protein